MCPSTPIPHADERRVHRHNHLVKGRAYILVHTPSAPAADADSPCPRRRLLIARFVSRRVKRRSECAESRTWLEFRGFPVDR